MTAGLVTSPVRRRSRASATQSTTAIRPAAAISPAAVAFTGLNASGGYAETDDGSAVRPC